MGPPQVPLEVGLSKHFGTSVLCGAQTLYLIYMSVCVYVAGEDFGGIEFSMCPPPQL